MGDKGNLRLRVLCAVILAIAANAMLTGFKLATAGEVVPLEAVTLEAVQDQEGYSSNYFYREMESSYKGQTIVFTETELFAPDALEARGISREESPSQWIELTAEEYFTYLDSQDRAFTYVYNVNAASNPDEIRNGGTWYPYDVIGLTAGNDEKIYEARCKEWHTVFFVPESLLPERVRVME